jgi:hypothetical protein
MQAVFSMAGCEMAGARALGLHTHPRDFGSMMMMMVI